MASAQTITMPIKLDGILLPVTTPFLANEEVDTQGLATNLGRWNNTGIIGYVVLGSTGERANLDETEYLQVIETARRAVPDCGRLGWLRSEGLSAPHPDPAGRSSSRGAAPAWR